MSSWKISFSVWMGLELMNQTKHWSVKYVVWSLTTFQKVCWNKNNHSVHYQSPHKQTSSVSTRCKASYESVQVFYERMGLGLQSSPWVHGSQFCTYMYIIYRDLHFGPTWKSCNMWMGNPWPTHSLKPKPHFTLTSTCNSSAMLTQVISHCILEVTALQHSPQLLIIML